jgi:hypothetical protein
MNKKPLEEKHHASEGPNQLHNLENTVPTLKIKGTETYHDVGIHNDKEAEEVFFPKNHKK